MQNIRNILMIEDSAGDRLLAEMTIKNAALDINMSFACDGQEGLEVISQLDEMPELILLDINMPRMNGYEFLEEYTKNHNSVPPIIAMLTSSSQKADREKAGQFACVKDYLVKPLTAEKLKKLEDYLES